MRLRVTASAESRLRSGHPWLYAESIREQNRAGCLGELAVVYDHRDRFLALGLFDPDSPLRLRVLHAGRPQTVDRAWWSARLERALAMRENLFDAKTTGFRWINGESDGWPGLVLDRYGGTCVLKLYTAAWLPRLDETVERLHQRLRPERIVLRLSRNIQAAAESQFAKANGQLLVGSPVEGPVVFLENGLRFESDVWRGQKTGFFLDQRENRRRVGTLARGRSVLNAFSFSGGFSLYAARGGAKAVTDLDISAHALAAAERNFALNESDAGVARCRQERIRADAFEWLEANMERKFNLIILDPPSFARRESERVEAIRAYGRLATLGLGHLSPGGVLVACSCSAHVAAEEFFGAVRRAAARSGRKLEVFDTSQHAPDHPATFEEAQYLKTVYLMEGREEGLKAKG